MPSVIIAGIILTALGSAILYECGQFPNHGVAVSASLVGGTASAFGLLFTIGGLIA